MPELDGFEITESIERDSRPYIVFLSLLNDFALQAFEVHALDSIQKPILQTRIEKCLKHLNKLTVDSPARVLDNGIGDLVRDFKKPKNIERLIIKQSGEYHLIRTKNIIWIEADGNYSRVMTKDKKFRV